MAEPEERPERPASEADAKPFPPSAEDAPTPGNQDRPMTEEEDLDYALEETFPASDPVSPSRIDGPGN